MPDMAPFAVIILVVMMALFFDFCNGWNDSANAIATVVSTRVLKPWQALLMNAVLNFVGALPSTAVAKTIAGKFVDEQIMTAAGVGAAMLAASAWVTICTWRGLPISGSHSLMGGIIGAALPGLDHASRDHPAVTAGLGCSGDHHRRP
jgi:PiT family inorganic phosphate transporter